MGLYDAYKLKVQSSLSDKELNIECITDKIKDDFYSHPNYYSVYTNGVSAIEYDVIIEKGNTRSKVVGYKTLISYPYDTYKFTIGDYIHWTYGDEATIWLLVANDKQYLYSTGGRIMQCNQLLKWKDSSGDTVEQNCVIDEFRFYNTQGVEETKYMRLPDNQKLIMMQNNVLTETLDYTQRFIFNEMAWKIIDFDRATGDTILFITVEKSPINSQSDDEDNEIAGDQNKPTVDGGYDW